MNEIDRLQIRWQNYRNWFYDQIIHSSRSLRRARMQLTSLRDGNGYGTSGSPIYTVRESRLNSDELSIENAWNLYNFEVVALDTRIKKARREGEESRLLQLLTEDAEAIISKMIDFFPGERRPE